MWFPRIGRGGFFRESGFPGCVSEGFRRLSDNFPRGFRGVPTTFRGIPEGFPTISRGVPEDFPKGSPKISRGVSDDFPKISRRFPRGFRRFPEDFPRGFRRCSEGFPVNWGHFRCRGRLFRSLPGWGSFPVTSSDVTAIVLLIWISGSLIGPFGSRGRNAAL